jgi:hypothetical protein
VGERPGTISLTASTNFPVCSNGLSVTCATSVSDSDKTKNGRHPIAECRPLLSRRIFSYGVISQTVPHPYAPPAEAVP